MICPSDLIRSRLYQFIANELLMLISAFTLVWVDSFANCLLAKAAACLLVVFSKHKYIWTYMKSLHTTHTWPGEDRVVMWIQIKLYFKYYFSDCNFWSPWWSGLCFVCVINGNALKIAPVLRRAGGKHCFTVSILKECLHPEHQINFPKERAKLSWSKPKMIIGFAHIWIQIISFWEVC